MAGMTDMVGFACRCGGITVADDMILFPTSRRQTCWSIFRPSRISQEVNDKTRLAR